VSSVVGWGAVASGTSRPAGTGRDRASSGPSGKTETQSKLVVRSRYAQTSERQCPCKAPVRKCADRRLVDIKKRSTSVGPHADSPVSCAWSVVTGPPFLIAALQCDRGLALFRRSYPVALGVSHLGAGDRESPRGRWPAWDRPPRPRAGPRPLRRVIGHPQLVRACTRTSTLAPPASGATVRFLLGPDCAFRRFCGARARAGRRTSSSSRGRAWPDLASEP